MPAATTLQPAKAAATPANRAAFSSFAKAQYARDLGYGNTDI